MLAWPQMKSRDKLSLGVNIKYEKKKSLEIVMKNPAHLAKTAHLSKSCTS